MALFIGSVLVALMVSFLCSLAEATLLSLTPSQIAAISLKRPKLGALWQDFKARIERPIAVILILNTSAHTIGAAIAGSQFNHIFGEKWIWVFSLIFTFLMIQFTEILPKTLGVRFNRQLAKIIAWPLNSSIPVFEPILKLVQWLNKPFGLKYDKTAATSTIEEISALAGLARLTNQIGSHQERIIKGASRLSGLSARQVMIPVQQISFLSASKTLMEALIAAHIDTHTRFPVCESDDPDKVLGYVNFKEMVYFMRTNPNEPNFRGIIRPVQFVSPEDSAANLLRLFVEQHVHIAIVKDAKGVTLGLVTLEDLVEELVGELEDEFDRLPKMFHTLSGGTWMVGGGVMMTELTRQIQLDVPPSQETLATWLGNRLGHIPKPGDSYKQGNIEFLVRRVKRGKAFEVAVTTREF